MGVVVVFSVERGFCIAEARCTHRQGPSTEGTFDGSTAPSRCTAYNATWRTGVVLRGPAWALKTYRVMVGSEVGRVDVPLAPAVQSE